jgi:rod shape determining protein RodA
MMIDRRLLIHFDWALLALVVVIASIGIVNLYSISLNSEPSGTAFYVKQLSWLLIGLLTMIVVAFVEYRYYSDFAYLIYGVTVFLLVVVMVFGMITSGAQRWIRIGSLSFQPSEFVKVSLIIVLAKYFEKPPDRKGLTMKDLLMPFLILIVPMGLILKQPDLGTAIILLLILSSTVLLVKIRWSSLFVIVLIGASTLPLLWGFLKEYQKKRIYTFFDPSLDPLGSGYHIIQSKVAVGSGGVFGKGFMKGTQCKLGFLPEQQTDFIFSVLAEEWGLLGSLLVISLYLILILWGLRIAMTAKDRFGAILAFGVVAMLFWHVFINIGMVVGIMPVVGIPLPLLSYGGSFMVSTLMGVGLLLNVSMRRYLF